MENKNKNQTIRRVSEIGDSSLFIPNYEEATTCSECGQALGPNAKHYTNGHGFCNSQCEYKYFNKLELGAKIHDALERLTRPLYRETDISRLPTDVYYDQKDPLFPVKGLAQKIINWNPKGSRGMLLHGDTGVGKTRLISLLIKNLVETYAMVGEYDIQAFYAGELKQELSKGFSSSKAANVAEKLMNKLTRCNVLILDDFGKEKFTEYYETSVFNIIERRISMMKPTIITTNYVGNTLKERFSDPETFKPFYRRLVEFNDVIGIRRK